MGRTERRRELVETHRAIQDANLPYVLVGGWAVSAFQTRFTTDIDVVIPAEALGEYRTLLADRGFTERFDRDVSNTYDGRIVGFEKSVGENAIGFEVLVDALRCRQTDAEWSYRYLQEYSTVESLNVAPDLTARAPEPALLFSLKLHSGRRADVRDLVVISTRADFDRIQRHLHRGNAGDLQQQIDQVLTQLTGEGFEDAFKGVFQQETLSDPDVRSLQTFLERQLDGR